jgi:RNA polymerase sigma-70 factor (ECF subfamily)
MERFPFDDEYVRRLKERDPETSAHFAAYFGGLLVAKLRRRLASREAIEDVRQEVLTRVLAKLDELQDGRKLGAFVHSFSDLVLKEWYRREARPDVSNGEEVEIADETSVEDELVADESRQLVRKVLGAMRSRDADLLRAIFFEDADKGEICRRFEVDRTYLRVLLHRALKQFRTEYCRKPKPPPDC